jgi:hypothetical protein
VALAEAAQQALEQLGVTQLPPYRSQFSSKQGDETSV